MQKAQKKGAKAGDETATEEILMFDCIHLCALIISYDEFHPFLPLQHEGKPYLPFKTFNEAVDVFFSRLEGQKLDMQAMQQVA